MRGDLGRWGRLTDGASSFTDRMSAPRKRTVTGDLRIHAVESDFLGATRTIAVVQLRAVERSLADRR